MKDLKPCPFCGGEMYVVDSSKLRRFTVYHKDQRNCHFYSFEIDWQTAGSLKEAREAWNRRSYERVEPQTGRWIGYNTDKDGWKRTDGSPIFMSCSQCHGTVFNNGSAHWNYCPNCGARMDKERK